MTGLAKNSQQKEYIEQIASHICVRIPFKGNSEIDGAITPKRRFIAKILIFKIKAKIRYIMPESFYSGIPIIFHSITLESQYRKISNIRARTIAARPFFRSLSRCRLLQGLSSILVLCYKKIARLQKFCCTLK